MMHMKEEIKKGVLEVLADLLEIKKSLIGQSSLNFDRNLVNNNTAISVVEMIISILDDKYKLRREDFEKAIRIIQIRQP